MIDLDAIEKKATAFLARWGKSSRMGHEIQSELERSAQDIALVEAVRAAQRETASLRHAALLAAGIHGGPGAWRWRSDPQGTTLDDVEAWERLLGEMAHGPSLQWEDVPGVLRSRARLWGNGARAPPVYLQPRDSDVWHIEYMMGLAAFTTEESVLDCPPVLTDDVKRMAEKWARYEGWIR